MRTTPRDGGTGRERHGEILRLVAARADEGRLRPLVDPTRFRLEDAPAAHRRATSGHAGKVVVEVS
jgi:NADPH:quinone reductase-like Zn-dependent oxidoreductase